MGTKWTFVTGDSSYMSPTEWELKVGTVDPWSFGTPELTVVSKQQTVYKTPTASYKQLPWFPAVLKVGKNEGKFRLYSRAKDEIAWSSGRLEVCHAGKWGSICNQG